MHLSHLLLFAAVLFSFVTSTHAEVVYSGVKSLVISPLQTELPLDVDSDGTSDLVITYGVMQTHDYPSTGMGGQVQIRAQNAHRMLVAGHSVAALPEGYAVQPQPMGGFIWAGEAEQRYGVSAGTWGRSGSNPWTGWQGFAAALDPVFGVELHSTAGIRFGWVRLRFSGTGGGEAQVYDWAYEAIPGQPITAGLSSNGGWTPPPLFENSHRPTAFVARLAGSKAVPPNSNPLPATASMSLTGNHLSVGVSIPSDGVDASYTIVQGRGEEQTIAFTSGYVAIHEPGSTEGATDPGATFFAGSGSISATLADAIRDGEAHLLLPLAGGALRGQIAQPLPEPPTVEPQPLTGSYTLLLRPQQVSTDGDARPAPTGVGHGQLHLSTDRSAALDVTLPLGAPMRWRGTLAADGTLTIDAAIGKAQGGGSVTGILTMTRSGTDYFVSGTLNWRRPPGVEGARYPRGFNVAMSVEGERHTTTRLRSNSYLLSLTGGPLRNPISVSLVAATSGAGTNEAAKTSLQINGANPHKVTIFLEPTTGVFRGTFRHTGNHSRVPFSGRMLSGFDQGAGAFTLLAKSGAVSISRVAELPSKPLGSLATHTLTPSTTDPDVVMLSASSIVPDTSYDLEMVARPVSVIPADGIYDFDLVSRKVADIGLTVVTNRTATIALQRNASFQGVRVHGALSWAPALLLSSESH